MDYSAKTRRRHTGSRERRAFSLLELMAVVTIMGILVAIVLPRLTHHTRYAKIKACNQFRSDLNNSIEKYLFENGVLPNQISDLSPEYYPDVLPVCPIDGSPYTLDPVTGRVQGHDHVP